MYRTKLNKFHMKCK